MSMLMLELEEKNGGRMLTMEAYLDNSATTRCSEAAKNKMVEALTVDFGNPSSMHMKGVEAEKYVKEAATAIAKTLRCQERKLCLLPEVQSQIIWLSSERHWQTSVQADILLLPV